MAWWDGGRSHALHKSATSLSTDSLLLKQQRAIYREKKAKASNMIILSAQIFPEMALIQSSLEEGAYYWLCDAKETGLVLTFQSLTMTTDFI